ncbi:flagellar export protein FliJ [Hydrogenophaga sp. 5NK40-0174]|uniref:flagellar export protein FliJ n=1 Tax=Hydrogenophaga sp. 5NK40-0174 TaxID=3127649 RepID=UPI00310B8D4B
MTSMTSLNKVVDLAEKRRDAALSALAQQQREMAMAQAQLDQLESYSAEAQQRWAGRTGVQLDASLLHHHRHFMDKIRHAVEFQRSVIGNKQAQIDRCQIAVHAAERDVAGLKKYVERQLSAQELSRRKREQKDTDEMAMNVYLRQMRANSEGARP